MTTGQRRFVFLEKGPLWFVCITSHMDLTVASMEKLLERIHKQFQGLLTSGVERELTLRPNLDIRPYVRGTDHVLNNLGWLLRDTRCLVLTHFARSLDIL
jgi:hypothetical protein